MNDGLYNFFLIGNYQISVNQDTNCTEILHPCTLELCGGGDGCDGFILYLPGVLLDKTCTLDELMLYLTFY